MEKTFIRFPAILNIGEIIQKNSSEVTTGLLVVPLWPTQLF